MISVLSALDAAAADADDDDNDMPKELIFNMLNERNKLFFPFK